jgi:hypothetical protein
LNEIPDFAAGMRLQAAEIIACSGNPTATGSMSA